MTGLESFRFREQQAVEQKLAHFAFGGADAMHVLLDFDRTLTCANEGGQDFYTWTILESFLPDVFQEPSAKLYRQYRPLELSGKMDATLANEWWNKSLQLMKDGGVNLYDVEREFVSRASIRPGVKELFELCKANEIPVAILSAGVTDVIEIWCRHFGVVPDEILATRLQLAGSGLIEGWDREKVIHPLNKREQGHGDLAALGKTRPLVVLVGDSLDDDKMADGNENVLRVRIYDPRPDERDNEAAQTASLNRFDLLLTGGSLMPLDSLMESIMHS